MYALLVCVVYLFSEVSGHGSLVDPPARNAMWRYGFDTPKNYNDMELNCGGFSEQWSVNKGKCGSCGDSYSASAPRDHEAGGKYAPVDRPLTRCYDLSDKVIPIKVRINSHHKGYFEFRLCENNNIAVDRSSCFENAHLLQIAGEPGVTRFDINDDIKEYYELELEMPTGVTCSQCILQWKYNAGNNWGCDDTGCGMGLGEQEQFYNCADISIVPDCENPTVTVQPTDAVTSKITDSVTVQPTGSPSGFCKAIGAWANPSRTYLDGWCTFNCLHPDINFCPGDRCDCD